MKKQVRTFLARMLARKFFLFCYFIGLTILIPYIIAIRIPTSIFDFTIPPITILITSMLLIATGLIGIYFLKGDLKSAMRALAWATFIPAAIALYILLFGDNIIRGLVVRFEYLEPIFEYMVSGIPHTLYLIAAYLTVSIVWFVLGRKGR